jgi:hypothetical protein
MYSLNESIKTIRETHNTKILIPFAAILTATLFQAPSTPPMKRGLWESTIRRVLGAQQNGLAADGVRPSLRPILDARYLPNR